MGFRSAASGRSKWGVQRRWPQGSGGERELSRQADAGQIGADGVRVGQRRNPLHASAAGWAEGILRGKSRSPADTEAAGPAYGQAPRASCFAVEVTRRPGSRGWYRDMQGRNTTIGDAGYRGVPIPDIRCPDRHLAHAEVISLGLRLRILQAPVRLIASWQRQG